MKRIFLVLLALLTTAGAAFSLSQSSIPPKFGVPWGNGAGAAYIRSIPLTSQIGIQNCAASLTDGFPPLTFALPAAGGCPPFGADFNGILKQLSQWNQWQAAGGPVFFDAAFAASAGGYPSGAKLASAVTPGTVWMSTADNNSTNPDTSSAANWVQDPGQVPIGTPTQSLSTMIPQGYVSANGRTIGNAVSNGTGRANADAQFLFNFVWNNCIAAICPIYTSSGSISTRGSDPWSDFAANKAIAVPNMNGSGIIGADSQNGTSSSFLAGVPQTSGGYTVPNSVVGENLHLLTAAQIPGIASSGTTANVITVYPAGNNTLSVGTTTGAIGVNSAAPQGGWAGWAITGTAGSATSFYASNNIASNVNSTNTGGGSHNTVERSTIVYWNLKL